MELVVVKIVLLFAPLGSKEAGLIGLDGYGGGGSWPAPVGVGGHRGKGGGGRLQSWREDVSGSVSDIRAATVGISGDGKVDGGSSMVCSGGIPR